MFFFHISAEFIIDLSENHNTLETFKKVLSENGANFSDSFVANLLRIIQHMRPPKNIVKDGGSTNTSQHDMMAVKFPGLAIPNDKPMPLSEPPSSDEEEEPAPKNKRMTSSKVFKNESDNIGSSSRKKGDTVVDDAMAALEALAPSTSHKIPSKLERITEEIEPKSSSSKFKSDSHKYSKSTITKDKKSRSRSPKREHRNRSPKRDQRSRSPKREQRSRSRDRKIRSRSRDKNSSRCHKSYYKDKRRSKSRDRKRSRSRSFDRKKSRSRSKDRKQSKAQDRKRSRSKSNERRGGFRENTGGRNRIDDSPKRFNQRGPNNSEMKDDPEPGKVSLTLIRKQVAKS